MATLQYSTKLRNAQMDMIMAVLKNLTVTSSAITGTATAPTMKIRSGALPETCATADAGTVLATISLTTTALTASASGTVAKNGTWQDLSADATGDAGHFRIYDSAGVCHMQGDITASGGAGSLTLDNINIQAGQIVAITSFSLTAGNS